MEISCQQMKKHYTNITTANFSMMDWVKCTEAMLHSVCVLVQAWLI